MIPVLFAREYTVFFADDTGIRASIVKALAAKGYTCSGQGILEMATLASARYTTYSKFGEHKPAIYHPTGRFDASLPD